MSILITQNRDIVLQKILAPWIFEKQVRIIQGFDGWRDFWGATGIKIDLSKTHLVREIIKLIRFTVEYAITGESSLKKSREYLTRPDHFSKILTLKDGLTN